MLPSLAHPAQPRGKVALAAARWVTEGKSTASVSITFLTIENISEQL